ncbi:MAG: sigma-54 dependent transcriptional regulator [Nitrospirota bacterium]
MNNKGNILIVDDEPNALRVLSAILSEEGYRVFDSINVENAIDLLHHEDLDAVVTDLRMKDRDGIDLFKYVSNNFADIPVIFLTAYGTVESAVSAIAQGAFYYFIKPPDYMKLKGIIARAVEQRFLKREIQILRKKLAFRDNHHRIIGNNHEICRILDTIESVKDSPSSVLIKGETGTGKEMVAKALHYQSCKKHMPFITINCAAIPKELLESELFGYEKGAFTGAVSRRIGKLEEASGGTLFLDEIGELELSLQTKFLRVLQEREIERIGSNKKIKVDFKLISSTNRDFTKEVREGRFREDLLYRINIVEIQLPPLRERKEDIPLFISEFTKDFCARENKKITVSDQAIQVLQNYSWPGNVRQLRNIIEMLIVLAKGNNITIRDLPEEIFSENPHKAGNNYVKTLRELETQAIQDAIRECNGNKSKAAKILGISRKAFYKRLKDITV